MTIFNKFFKNHLTIPQATKLFEKVKSQTHPDIADLKRLVDFHKAPVGTKDELQALDLKYRTMTPEQLYNANSPFWANEYNIKDLEKYFSIDERPSYNDTVTFINAFRH